MKQTIRTLALMAAFLVAVGVVSSVLNDRAIAQIRAALVREMDSSIRGVRHVERFLQPFFGGGSNSGVQTITPTVPAGKKLFLQSISLSTSLTGLTPIQSRFIVNTGSAPIVIYLDQRLQGTLTGWASFFAGNREINMLLNPGESISVSMSANSAATTSDYFEATVFGYLVDANP